MKPNEGGNRGRDRENEEIERGKRERGKIKEREEAREIGM